MVISELVRCMDSIVQLNLIYSDNLKSLTTIISMESGNTSWKKIK